MDPAANGRPTPEPGADEVKAPREALTRPTVEFLLMLVVGILLLRTFATEAYVVPTGSMAPTLLGLHKELICPNCKFPLVVGVEEEGPSRRPVCPNCGEEGFSPDSAVESNGDRLLVQKFLFDVRSPRRWEAAVFQSPAEPGQAYVKRVVGLPREAVQIVDGDVFIDGRIARKSLKEQRAMRILVFDNDYVPADSDRFPRWLFRADRYRRALPSGWHAEGTRFVHEPTSTSDDVEDWLEYRHYDPDRSKFGPIRDFCPYNGGDVRGDNVVRDLMVEAEISIRPDVRSVSIRVEYGRDQFVIVLPVDGRGLPEARRSGRVLEVVNARGGLMSSPRESPRFARVEVSTIDRRISVAIDGVPVFDPIDFEEPDSLALAASANPVALGVLGGWVEVRGLKVFRDIYYTGSHGMGARRPFGIDEPYQLGPGEFFVLGDNSPVSNDSRFWERSPVVTGDRFLGKPFLVHLPGQVYTLKVFGRPMGWIPDPREIRYIR